VDGQTLINIIGGALLSVFGWFARQLWDSVKELKDDLHKIEVDMPTTYVTKASVESRFDKIDHQFDVLFERLNKMIEQSIIR
jgi:hypothetical protein